MGLTVGALVIPQFIIQAMLYLGAAQIMPLTTPDMLADFSACGGLIMLATFAARIGKNLSLDFTEGTPPFRAQKRMAAKRKVMGR